MKDKPTKKEQAWIKRLEKTVAAMPKTLEIGVTFGQMVVLPTGSILESFKKHGHLDRFDENGLAWIDAEIEPCSEAL